MFPRRLVRKLGLLLVLVLLTLSGVAHAAPVDGAAAPRDDAPPQVYLPPAPPNDEPAQIYLPILRNLPPTSTSITAGGSHTCALTTAGGVQCWGSNQMGQLGDGTPGWKNSRSMPVDVVGLSSGVRAVTAGGEYTCALTTAGGVECWGWNEYGQLGNGASGWENNRSTPVDVVSLSSGVRAIATGYTHTCALTTGAVKCWGSNGYGQLGDGTSGQGHQRNTPVDVIGLSSDVTAITAGAIHTCALTTGGGVKCWGNNGYGQLGDGASGVENQRNTPVDVTGLGSGVVAIAAGGIHTCALTTDGGVKCWGNGWYGQLGDGTSGQENQRNTPVDVTGLGSGVVAIAAGGNHTCALTTAGVKCWGANWYGQLGDGAPGWENNRSTPVDVIGLSSDTLALAAGESHTCAVTLDQGATKTRIQCWGANFNGQLGDG